MGKTKEQYLPGMEEDFEVKREMEREEEAQEKIKGEEKPKPLEMKVEEEEETEEKFLPAELAVLRKTINRHLSESIKQIAGEREPGIEKKGETRLYLTEEYLRQKMLLGRIAWKFLEKIYSYKRPKTLSGIERILKDVSLDQPLKKAIKETVGEYYKAWEGLERFIQEKKPQEIFDQLSGCPDWKLKGDIKMKSVGNILFLYLEEEEDFARFLMEKKSLTPEETERAKTTYGTSGFKKGIPFIAFNGLPGIFRPSTYYHELTHQLYDQVYGGEKEEKKEDKPIEVKSPSDLAKEYLDYWQVDAKEEILSYMALSITDYQEDYSLKYHPDFCWRRYWREVIEIMTNERGSYDYPFLDRNAFFGEIKEKFPKIPAKEGKELYNKISQQYYDFVLNKLRFIDHTLGRLGHPSLMKDFQGILLGEDVTKWERILRLLQYLGKNFNKAFEITIERHKKPYQSKFKKEARLTEKALNRHREILQPFHPKEYRRLKEKIADLFSNFSDAEIWWNRKRDRLYLSKESEHPEQKGLAMCDAVNEFLLQAKKLLKDFRNFRKDTEGYGERMRKFWEGIDQPHQPRKKSTKPSKK